MSLKKTNQRHVAHVVQHLRPGGIECLALELQRMMSRDLRVSIVSLEGAASDAFDSWPRLRAMADHLVFLEKPEGIAPRSVLKLANWLRRERVRVVHTHHIGPLLYGGIAAALTGARVIHTEHDAWHLSCPKRARLQRSLLGLLRPHVVADANLVARAFENALDRKPNTVIHNGVDCERFAPGDAWAARRALGLSHEGPLIGCAARLETVKGVDRLISAVPALRKDAHVAIAGDGSQARWLRSLADGLGVSDRVHFLGAVDEMETFYQAIDVFCLASRNEGLPLSPLEAQACGVPVVATEVGGMAEAVCPHTGRLVEPDDADGLVKALLSALRQEGPVSPRYFVEDTVSLDNTVRRYRDVYGFAG